MKKLFCTLIVAMVAPLLGGCLNDIGNFGYTSPPPSALAVTAEDGRVMVTWTVNPGIEYWLFSATDPSLTAFNWANLANPHAYVLTTPPFYVCGLFSGTPYYYAANGRTNGGPGGPSSPTISATPYNASANWHASLAPISSQNLYGVGYTSLTTCSNNATSATGSFAAVGAAGTLLTSNDGQNWNTPTWNTPASLPPAFDLYAVTGYTANLNNPTTPGLRWVAVGTGEGSVYSTDGINWYVGKVADPTLPPLRSLTHAAGTFFAVGDAPSGGAGTILSSTDGIIWTSHTSGTTSNLRAITHGAIYVAVGDSGTLLTSGDGNTWTTQTSVTPPTTNTLRQVASNGNIIVAVGDGGTIVTSINGGSTWTTQALSGTPSLVGITTESLLVINPVADPLLGFISNAQFVAVDSIGNAYTSTNGLIWSTPVSTGIPTLSNLGQPMVSSGFGYVAVGNVGASAHAF